MVEMRSLQTEETLNLLLKLGPKLGLLLVLPLPLWFFKSITFLSVLMIMPYLKQNNAILSGVHSHLFVAYFPLSEKDSRDRCYPLPFDIGAPNSVFELISVESTSHEDLNKIRNWVSCAVVTLN